jgi:hypothetical protein
MEQTTGYYNTFIIRIWNSEPAGKFRGYIQHARTQERVYFDDLISMNEFIRKNLNPPRRDFVKNDNNLLN